MAHPHCLIDIQGLAYSFIQFSDASLPINELSLTSKFEQRNPAVADKPEQCFHKRQLSWSSVGSDCGRSETQTVSDVFVTALVLCRFVAPDELAASIERRRHSLSHP